eukprot:CAMPEP_0183713244 /NCGR_PEP_ID=MMETSP0737-20130205/8139_1 /TAXON_ID=385413 /ORGANISM="Thalassiosira miniscula, Strain CCMP1093" /LENGTH=908 /DNA_ID=CAMNT_0025941997 /DNA_START=158 /DNA_END=2884 /DNA_ORIENTATION=+
MASSNSAIRRQVVNAILKSSTSSAAAKHASSSCGGGHQWTAASVAILASASAAICAISSDNNNESTDHPKNHMSANSGSCSSIDALFPPLQRIQKQQQRGAVVQCEASGMLPYQRLSQRAADDNANNSASTASSSSSGSRNSSSSGSSSSMLAAFGPWMSDSSSSSSLASTRKSLLQHRQTRSERKRSETKDVDMNEKYDVDFTTVLGEGAYGRVHPATLVETGEKVALKKISKRYTDSKSFGSETDALLRIYDNGGHPNISGLRDMYEDFSHYYLFLDLAQGGEMFDHLIQHGQYSELDASRLVSEILSALAFLHNIGVVHADLKPENILLCSRKQGAETVKIIDFGCASVEKRGESPLISGSRGEIANNKRRNAAVVSTGTKAYWSPERFQNNSNVLSESDDLWALGVIVFIMLVGVHPFDITGISNGDEIAEEIRKGASPPMALASHLSPSARDFIRSLMERDPNKRLTAITALQHPWIRGVTPTLKIIEGSDTKLSMYQELRDKLASGIFAALVDGENLRNNTHQNGIHEHSLTHLLKRAFQIFDEEGKGRVDEEDLVRVMTKVTGKSLSPSDSKDMIAAAKKESSSLGLSLSDFSQLFSRLSHRHYKRGDYIYNPGDGGHAMYFINSGKVEILSQKGHLVSILRHGDFFGEGSLLEDRNYRITAARCSTPVELIEVSKDDFKRYLESSSTKRSLKLKWRARTLAQAKQLIRLQTNLTKRQLRRGDVVYREGDVDKKSMFLVDEGTLEVKHGKETLHKLTSGDSFGESSLLFQRPRSSTVVCASERCRLLEMKGEDFQALLESDPSSARAFNDICRQRMFRKAVKSYLLSQNSALGDDSRVFRDADKDKSGTLNLSEVRDLMLHMGNNSAIPEKDILELLKSLDLDEDGQVSLNDILEMSKAFK